MNRAWLTLLRQLLTLLVLGVAPVFVFYGREPALLATIAGLVLLLCWHLYQLSRLLRWLAGPLDSPLPEGGGVWEIAFAGLHRRARIRSGQQQSLADALERFTRAAQALPDGIIVFDRHRRIDWMNTRAEAHFSLSGAADRGQALTNLIRHPEFIAYLDAGKYDEPLVFRGARSGRMTLLLQVIPYGGEQTLLLSRDISHLERLERMRSDFIANVSHELKSPLTVVAGFAEMLAEDHAGYSQEELSRYLQLINEQSLRMRRLIEDLLTLSALETGGDTPVEERVEVEPLLQTILGEAQALSAGRHQFSLLLDEPATLRGCASELRSAFGNLASNAVRYTPEGGRIDLHWQREADGGGRFTVADTGIGVAPQHLPRLTERFYRVDRSRSRETGGTGLGLAIVKHVLTRHHATLEIDSEPGHGSRFSARFPAGQLLV
ncbi:phosphate regulon sensor histidine kinase PhoR [Rhodocyclus tenuis]|uniref:Phosphate regulon sensor protein PhoR n=1 Tax=Rhodocyclus tenuis TaxID=1066 RepID=A0A840GBU7_RHOTE|nr:phosphate regulon sensor histidine kinase PhoR [Rhodocyclus tenuis]MBB4248941.1 two-component system phosphate regulon sensor histidine kinase PhoR [Rhodocyclus tenuis]